MTSCLTVIECLFHKWRRIRSNCCNHNPSQLLIECDIPKRLLPGLYLHKQRDGATIWAGSADYSWAPGTFVGLFFVVCLSSFHFMPWTCQFDFVLWDWISFWYPSPPYYSYILNIFNNEYVHFKTKTCKFLS